MILMPGFDGTGELFSPFIAALSKSMPAAAVAARLNVLADLQVRALCRNIRTPILILRATGDRLVSPSRYKQLIEALPCATVKEVEGPHLLLQSRPRECAQLIEEFLSTAPEIPASMRS